MFRARRCERCGEPFEVETIWADENGQLDPATPADVHGRRRGEKSGLFWFLSRVKRRS